MPSTKVIPVLFAILLSPVLSWADSITSAAIFADLDYIGAVGCDEAGAGDYCEKPIPTTGADGQSQAKKNVVSSACVRGGGDCMMVIFGLAKKESDPDHLLIQIHDKAKQPAWIRIPKKSFKSVESWIPDLGTGQNYVEFRPDLKFVYEDRELTKKIPIDQVYPHALASKQGNQDWDIEYVQTEVFQYQGRKFIEIQANSLEIDPRLNEENPYEASEKAKRHPVQKFYFPAYNSKGRINYWYQPGSC